MFRPRLNFFKKLCFERNLSQISTQISIRDDIGVVNLCGNNSNYINKISDNRSKNNCKFTSQINDYISNPRNYNNISLEKGTVFDVNSISGFNSSAPQPNFIGNLYEINKINNSNNNSNNSNNIFNSNDNSAFYQNYINYFNARLENSFENSLNNINTADLIKLYYVLESLSSSGGSNNSNNSNSKK